MIITATAGNREKQDALVTISRDGNPLRVVIETKVEKLYGKSIKKSIEKVLLESGVDTGIVVKVEDFQAAPFVIRARVKAAVLRLNKEK